MTSAIVRSVATDSPTHARADATQLSRHVPLAAVQPLVPAAVIGVAAAPKQTNNNNNNNVSEFLFEEFLKVRRVQNNHLQ